MLDRRVLFQAILSVLVNHRDTENTEQTLFLPDRETAIGQKNSALWAIYFRRWIPRWRSAWKQKAYRRQAMAFSLVVVSRPGKT
jgi:hypothetical protein